jgi:hypothetical protein
MYAHRFLNAFQPMYKGNFSHFLMKNLWKLSFNTIFLIVTQLHTFLPLHFPRRVNGLFAHFPDLFPMPNASQTMPGAKDTF